MRIIQKDKRILFAVIIAMFCLVILAALIWVFESAYPTYKKLKYAEQEARKSRVPGYRQKVVLRLINGEKTDIENLEINYEDKSIVIEKLKPFQFFRLPVESGAPLKIEFTYSCEDGREYRIAESSHMPADNEIHILLKQGQTHGRAMGPIDPNLAVGLGPDPETIKRKYR